MVPFVSDPSSASSQNLFTGSVLPSDRRSLGAEGKNLLDWTLVCAPSRCFVCSHLD